MSQKLFKNTDKTASLHRTTELWATKKALLETWEAHPNADPEYLLKLKKQVDNYEKQLVYKGYYESNPQRLSA